MSHLGIRSGGNIRHARRLTVFVFALASALAFLLPGVHPISQAAPILNLEEQGFFNQIYRFGHPRVPGSELLVLGYQACSVRLAGGSTDDAKVSVYRNLSARGVISSNAEIGTLVRVAVNTLCPEVGYP